MYKTLSGPLVVQVEISTLCTNRCLHCYNFWRRDENYTFPSNLSMEGIERIMKQLIALKVFHIVFTGGEPLLNKRILFYGIEKATEANITVGLNSNLVPLAFQDAKSLKHLGVTNVLTSLMGPSAEIHDEIAQLKGAFNATVRGIQLLQKFNIPVTVNMVVSQKNKHLIRDTAVFVKKLGVDHFSSTRVGWPGNCNDFSEFSLSLKDFRDYLKELHEIGLQEKITTSVLESYPLCAIKELKQYKSFIGRHCLAGVTTITVATNGEVRPCSHLDISYGNILIDDLSTIWEHMKEWRDGSLLPEVCRSCRLLLICGGGCRMEAKMRSGSLNGVDPYISPKDIEYAISQFVENDTTEIKRLLPSEFSLNPKIRYRREAFGSVIFIGPRLKCYLNRSATKLIMKLKPGHHYKLNDFGCQVGDKIFVFLTELYNRQVLV